MARRRRGIMSEELKYELAKELGVYDTVMREGWGSVPYQRLRQPGTSGHRKGGGSHEKQTLLTLHRKPSGFRSLSFQPVYPLIGIQYLDNPYSKIFIHHHHFSPGYGGPGYAYFHRLLYKPVQFHHRPRG